jgi:hypothetical protein
LTLDRLSLYFALARGHGVGLLGRGLATLYLPALASGGD